MDEETEEEDDKEWSVEAIISDYYNVQQQKNLYQVKWKGYSANNNTFEPLEHLQRCQKKLFEYLDQKKNRKKINPKYLKPKLFRSSDIPKK